MIIYLIKTAQPIGDFFLGKLSADVIIDTTKIIRRRDANEEESANADFIQRAENTSRIKDITKFTTDPDSVFPTPIIISVDDKLKYELTLIDNDLYKFEFDESNTLGNILDGQHRLLGIANSEKKDKFELPIVLMFNMTLSEKAYVFATVNGTQTKVPTSLIYDLFGIVEGRSPQKTCHELARIFNSDTTSAFYDRLKMLGNKEGELQYLSQGTFVKYLLKHLISTNPQRDLIEIKTHGIESLKDENNKVLRYLFLNNQDDKIYKILFNYFAAVKKVFPDEWNQPENFILTKAIGFGGLIKAFKRIYILGIEEGTLEESFFETLFIKVKNYFISNNISFSIDDFKSGESEENRLAKTILDALEL